MEVERSSRKRERIVTESWKSKRLNHHRVNMLSVPPPRRPNNWVNIFSLPIGLNDWVNIFPLLFPNPYDFLITNNGRQVRESELRGKTILLHMEPLLGNETFHLIETYHELWPRGGFEVVFVPVNRGRRGHYSEQLLNELFSHMPWPAVPLYNKLACARIQHLANSLHPNYSNFHCPWVVFSPRGNVLLKHDCEGYDFYFFNYLGGADCPLSSQELLRLEREDRATLEAASVINLNKLLSTPSRDFLLTKHGNKVPISSLEGKVVGLYFCDDPIPRQLERISKVYQEALDLGYEFEIVQINFHFPNYSDGVELGTQDLPAEPCLASIPWLALPFKDPCCRRLRRIFKTYKGNYFIWRGERLVIINPPEPSIGGVFFDNHGADIMEYFGIEAYPFTRRRVVEIECATTWTQKLSLQQNLGPLLLQRRRGGGSCGFDQVPVSRLWGKRVLVVFAGHSLYNSRRSLPSLEAKYVEQEGCDDDKLKFEVVYVSTDVNRSSFEEFTKSMPWLVHPYSMEIAHKCMSNLFHSHIMDVQSTINAAAAVFSLDGSLLAKTLHYRCDDKEYPFNSFLPTSDVEILSDVQAEMEHLGSSCHVF